jgi:hypothetical protein
VRPMGTKGRRLAPTILLLVMLGLVFALGGCGGSSSPDSAASAASTTNASSTADKASEPNAEFGKSGNPNPIVEFGHEAPTAEREAVSPMVEKSLKARAAGNFSTQCQTLSLAAIKKVPEATSRKDCPAALKEFASPLPETAQARKDTLTGPIDAMRVKGDKGWALYHGNDGKDYGLPLEKEGSTWKVGSVLTTEIL